MTVAAPQGVHLVGSINLPDAETTMATVARTLGSRVKRVPDGEVGERFHWIAFQANRLAETSGLERVGENPILVSATIDVRPVRIAAGRSAAEISIGNLGYADAALNSWQVFARLQADGVIPAAARFQVSLPTPAAVVGAFVVAEDRAALEPRYRDALYAELDRILAAIPGEKLAVQWDTAVEFGFIENAGYAKNAGNNEPWFENVWEGVVERAVDQISRVPAAVQVGFHLCYGDIGERHFVEPTNTENLVRFANLVLAASPRTVNWMHLPVPIERDDDGYYEALSTLDLPEATELYLGLVHREDGVEGARKRIEVAQRYAPGFGVATECGFGRSPENSMQQLFATHAELARSW